MNYLLDTCTFLWLALPQGKLSTKATNVLNNPDNSFYLSEVSIWEICLKHAAGKLPLPSIPRHWLPDRIAFFQLTRLQIDYESLITSGELPRVHLDPFDRLLAAQALGQGLIILSPDTPLSALGAARIW